MNPETIERLQKINQKFYSEFASPFSDTRSRPWDGWDEVLTHLDSPPRFATLDVGCGNGRLVSFLQARGRLRSYLGLDGSNDLLAVARERHAQGARIQFDELDVLQDLTTVGQRFNLVVAFGLLHHVPGEKNRQRLVEWMAERLVPGGYLVLSIWHFEPLLDKTIPWEQYNDSVDAPVDAAELEPGDLLISWNRGGQGQRYCHLAQAGEVEGLISASGLDEVVRFSADGKSGTLNEYVILRA